MRRARILVSTSSVFRPVGLRRVDALTGLNYNEAVAQLGGLPLMVGNLPPELAGEYLAHSYYDEMGLPTAVVRPFNIYGPNQVGSGAIHHFTVRGLAGDELIIHGDGSQIRAWCYVDDMVAAVELCLEHPAAVGHSFNVGNARSTVTITMPPGRRSFSPITAPRRVTPQNSAICQ